MLLIVTLMWLVVTLGLLFAFALVCGLDASLTVYCICCVLGLLLFGFDWLRYLLLVTLDLLDVTVFICFLFACYWFGALCLLWVCDLG